MKKILLLEDDNVLGETIVEMLQDEGYSVDWAKDGESAAELSYDVIYALYLLDVNVPFLNGFELLESLRSAKDATPALFMSARVDLESISHGFRAGAFDYIKKPFFPQELMIRINAKIGSLQQKIIYEDIEYDPTSKEVRKDKKILQFGEVQFLLFDLFIRRQNEIVSKEEMLECMEHPSSTALRVALNKLKQNTGFNIKNIRGVGYMLEQN